MVRERTIGTVATLLLAVSLALAVTRLDEQHRRASTSPTAGAATDVGEVLGRAMSAPQPAATPAPEGALAFFDPSESDDSPPPPSSSAAAPAAASSWFRTHHPAHARATESAGDPATTRWALLIGVNDHTGRTRDNVGSRQDAEDLAAHLRALGWRDDHVLLLTDETATRRHIREGLSWLAHRTSEDSVVVIHYSGHVKQWYGWDVDSDGETTDEALWPSDNQFITDAEFSARVDRIAADRLWVNVAGCEAAGFADAPILRSRMVMTFSSEEDEKSYEDPSKDNSVWGWYLVDRGMMQGYADADGDAEITVEEAFDYADNRAVTRTTGQSHGAQHPVMIDRLPGDFSLEIPQAPPPPRPAPTAPADDDPPAGDEDEGGIIGRPPEDEDCTFSVLC